MIIRYPYIDFLKDYYNYELSIETWLLRNVGLGKYSYHIEDILSASGTSVLRCDTVVLTFKNDSDAILFKMYWL